MCTNNMYVGCVLYVNLCLCLCLCLCVNPARVSSFFVCVCLSGNEFNHITSDQIRSNQIRFTAIVCVREERYRILFNCLFFSLLLLLSFLPLLLVAKKNKSLQRTDKFPKHSLSDPVICCRAIHNP